MWCGGRSEDCVVQGSVSADELYGDRECLEAVRLAAV